MHSWIKDLGYGRSEEENVFYALLEQAELLGGANEEETFSIYFDAVVAGDLEAMPLNGESLSLENEWWRECRSALLEITLTTQQFINWISPPEDEIYGIWFKITLSENPVGDMVNTPVQNFMNLIDDPIQKYLKSIDRLDKNDRKLKALSDCLNGLEATDRLLWEDTSAIPNEEIRAVNVIDVGQGNMNVVEAGNAGDAIIFYDFGGGVGAARVIPTAIPYRGELQSTMMLGGVAIQQQQTEGEVYHEAISGLNLPKVLS